MVRVVDVNVTYHSAKNHMACGMATGIIIVVEVLTVAQLMNA